MIEYILVLGIFTAQGDIAVTSIVFPSAAACEAAKAMALHEFTATVYATNLRARARCIPRGTP